MTDPVGQVLDAIADSKPAEVVAFEKMLATAAQLTACADEFYPDYPEALSERVEAHLDAVDAWVALQ